MKTCKQTRLENNHFRKKGGKMLCHKKIIGLFHNNYHNNYEYFAWYQNILYILAYSFSGEKGCLLIIQTRNQVNELK